MNMLYNIWYYFNRFICFLGLRFYRFSDKGRTRASYFILWLQFLVIGRPFAKYRDPKVYTDAVFKYKWQFDLWYKLGLFVLRYLFYPRFNKKWAEREMAWFVLESLRDGFKRY